MTTNQTIDISELRKVREYKIASVREDVPKVKVYTISPVNGRIPAFVSGQFVNLHVDGSEGKKIFRAYSVASTPDNNDLELCIKILDDGRLSSVLDKKNIGDVVGISGPYGFFKYESQPKCVFIAAGTGIAPVIGMLRHIRQNKIAGDFLLMYTNKFENSIIYHDELKKMNGSSSNVQIVFTLTQDASPHWSGERGRIDREMLAKHMLGKNANDYHYYICGPLEFIRTLKEAVISMGAKAENIKVEGWG